VLAISALRLFVYYIFRDSNRSSKDADSKKYSDIFIAEELDSFFQQHKPFLNPDYKISALEKQLKVSRKEISLFTKRRFGRNFNQFLNLWRVAELRHLKTLPENRNLSIEILCQKAGFKNKQQYILAEKERKAINMKNRNSKYKNSNKDKPVVEQTVKIKDPDSKKKPEINMRV
jgi:methylphosphotriester-DNA--protein-cysteine methyltransferase